ncbi:MAG: universal stress protein [Pyrinomonadaceae bacterium]|nr:universal stress protein [Pyrinomonadaceae bacterium]
MKVLIPVDGSENSKLALDEVARRAWNEGSSFKIIHVVHPPIQVTDMMGVGAELAKDTLQKLVEKGRIILDEAETILKSKIGEFPVTTQLIETPTFQSPQEVIVSTAESDGTDLIVMASRGFSLWKRITVGSVSLAVIQHAPCSVEIVREKENK